MSRASCLWYGWVLGIMLGVFLAKFVLLMLDHEYLVATVNAVIVVGLYVAYATASASAVEWDREDHGR